ncbi:hypothetical protein B0H14DRAFT_3593245 [Mycena olivaceomarginata]|nr:hypothetical protein B0H14DRAFT_3593245 [Mycena olivaceomarginata]
MPPSSPAPADRIFDYTSVAANALHDIATASQIPFLARVSTITLTIVPMVQNTRFQQERCLRIMEEIHHSLCALTSLAIHSDNIQAPKMLDQIARYAGTLQRFDSCLRSQQELGTLKRLFKQGEITAQLDTCERELRALLAIFTIGRDALNASSGSFSLLPASPKIFHGRECELEELVDILMADSARITILGPGGMGKTTLAMAALHHPKVATKYQTRHFISCESTHTRDSLVAIIVSHLGLDTSSTSERAPCLIILDNFETPWEALEGRAKVEAFLALLADIPHVALLLTMRGAERPGKVQWTHPFIRPLMPLDQAAARQTFIEIADEFYDDSEVDQLLEITDNIPLAVQLVAGVAASVGCQETIERWNVERTDLLSAGYDKRSNLEISIMLSLSSPRLQSSSHAVELLRLMSLLSDGISDLDLFQSNIPIQDIPSCKTTLIRTSLAYVDHAGQLKVLAPIRDYIRVARPPSLQLVRPLRKYLIDLLKLYMAWWDASAFAVDLVPHLVSNLGNLHSLLLHGLGSDHSDLKESILGIIMLNHLSLRMNRGLTPLMTRLPDILSGMDDHGLYGRFITEALEAWQFYTLPNLELAIDKAIEDFRIIQDRDEEAGYYFDCARDVKKAEDFHLLALSVASQCNSDAARGRPLGGMALTEWHRGNYYSKALQLAKETYRIGRVSGDVRGELNGIRFQALCYSALGNFQQSLELLDEGKELIIRAGVQGGRMESQLMNIEANVYQDKTEYSNARRTSTDIVVRNLEAGRSLFRKAQYPRGLSLCECNDADLRLREGDVEGARVEYIRLFAAARGRDTEVARYCVAKLADPLHPHTESARWAFVFLAFAVLPQVRSVLTVHQALRCLGEILLGQGAEDTALSILAVALDGFTQMDVHQSRAECMYTMGDVYVRRGDLCRAREMWEAARPLFERSEQKKQVSGIEERLQTLGVAQTLGEIPQVELPTFRDTMQNSGRNEETERILIPDL